MHCILNAGICSLFGVRFTFVSFADFDGFYSLVGVTLPVHGWESGVTSDVVTPSAAGPPGSGWLLLLITPFFSLSFYSVQSVSFPLLCFLFIVSHLDCFL